MTDKTGKTQIGNDDLFLALDAGGTQTRAALVAASGRILGYGRSGSGNPTSAGPAAAASSLADAVGQAMAGAPADCVGDAPSLAVVAMAGEQNASYLAELEPRLAPFGVRCLHLVGDLLAMFHSGTPDPDGYALICGTGAIAARVRGGELERTLDGNGWLLGDVGSGFWIGQQIARAVIAALDGWGPPTALTSLVLAETGVPGSANADEDQGWSERRETVRDLVSVLYADRPVRLSRFAPLAFAVTHDEVAREILASAASALAGLLATLRTPDIVGPVVGGGGVLLNGFLAASPEVQDRIGVPNELRELIRVKDGLLGAIVLGFRELGISVDDAFFAQLNTAVARATVGG